MAQIQKNKMNELIAWESYLKKRLEDADGAREAAKQKTQVERATLRELNAEIKAARWKIGKLMGDLEASVNDAKEQELKTTLNLDDFGDFEEIDIELVKGEMKKAKEKENA